MIKFTDVSFGFPQKELYEKICFEIEEKEHVVLIGSNGTGKSTLVDMMIRTEDYLYDGKIEKQDKVRIGLVSQFVSHSLEEKTVYDFLAEPFVAMQEKADAVCAEMEHSEDMEAAYEKYQLCLDEMDAVDAYNYDSNIKKQLAMAGIAQTEQLSLSKISGGEFKLISIIRNMLLKPQLLIMDEPDAFLDFENLVGLTKLINGYAGTVLVITHSRLLLRQCFQKVLHLENKELQEFPGNFAEYNRALLETKVAMQEQATKDAAFIEVQQKVVDSMRKAATNVDSAGKGRQLKARVSYLERLQARKAENPFIAEYDYDFSFPEVSEEEENDSLVLALENYELSYEQQILTNVNFQIHRGEKIAIVGANGTGKSSMLHDMFQLLREEQKEKVALFSQIYEQDGEEKLSGGERNIRKLREIAKGSAQVIFLDEPTSHLDTYAQIALERAIAEYQGTIIMVSHDFYTIANCADRILFLENRTVREMSGRAYRKSIYKKYFDSDIFEQERLKKELEIKVNALLKTGKYEEAKTLLEKS